MNTIEPSPITLPRAADGALEIVRKMTAAGHVAYLAGGCVRDLLLGLPPEDYDVATDATPERVCDLFRPTRRVGAQFGVVLVRRRRDWIEVATFRAEGAYLDGRRPSIVTFGDARQDALRRDFTINGMFYDPRRREVVDFVDGRADLERGVVRAIGDPPQRFAEDHLRLIRAVRFAARLGFAIEPATLAAIRAHAAKLRDVAPERVREELERMLSHPSRARGWSLLVETGLHEHLWPEPGWSRGRVEAAARLLAALPHSAGFEVSFSALVADRPMRDIEFAAEALRFSCEQHDAVAWIVRHQADLDQPEAISLADLKRLIAGPALPALRQFAAARLAADADGAERLAAIEKRIAAIPPEQVRPDPLVTGDDLLARNIPQGPLYREILDQIYTEQLNERIRSRAEALAALESRLERAAAR